MPFKKGHMPWNKGLKGVQVPWNKRLTKETDERVKRYGEKGAKSRNWKGKTYEEIYGIDRALEIKKSQTKARKGKPHPVPWLKGVPRTEEVKRKISEAQKGEKHHFFGQHHSEEAKRKRSEALKGKHTSPRTEFKKRHPSYVKKGDKHPFFGKRHTPEALEKMSKTWFKKGGTSPRKGKHLSEETKRKLVKWNKGKHLTKETKDKLRTARLNQKFPIKDTSIEVAVQTALNKAGVKFKTHYPIVGQPDIFIKPNLCVFCDGDYWHNRLEIQEKDRRVNEELQRKGYKVVRLWEYEIRQLPEEEIVKRVLDQTKPVITPTS